MHRAVMKSRPTFVIKIQSALRLRTPLLEISQLRLAEELWQRLGTRVMPEQLADWDHQQVEDISLIISLMLRQEQQEAQQAQRAIRG